MSREVGRLQDHNNSGDCESMMSEVDGQGFLVCFAVNCDCSKLVDLVQSESEMTTVFCVHARA